MTLKNEILDLKFAHFDRFEGSLLAILGVEKVFWTFSKLFWRYLGSVLGIAFGLKRPTFGYIFSFKVR